MSSAQILYSCGPAQRAPNGLRLPADVAIRCELEPFCLADTHGTVDEDGKSKTNTVFAFFSHILRSCGSGNPARPNYRLIAEPIVTAADFERVKRTGEADVGDGRGQIRPLAYSMTFLFTHEGYDSFSAELEAEIARRKTAKGRRDGIRPGSHEAIQSFPTLLRYLSYGVAVAPGTHLRVAQDERPPAGEMEDEPSDSPDGHLLDILDPRRPLNVEGASPHQTGSYIHRDTSGEEGAPAFYWQAPWSTTPGGINPLNYVFGEAFPWNLAGDSNDWFQTALIGTPTPLAALKKVTASRSTVGQKRKILNWDVARDGPIEKIFRGDDPDIGQIPDPRLSIPLYAPPPSRRGVSRVAADYEPMANYERHGYRALGSIRYQTEQRLDLVAGPDDLPALLDYLDRTITMIQSSTGTVAPPQFVHRMEFGGELYASAEEDAWARGFFSKCRTAEELSERIQLCLAKFFGLSAAQIAFGFGLIFCGQVLPLLTTCPRMHIFCVGKAMAGKSVVVDTITSLLFPSALRRFDSSSAQAASCDTVSGMTIQIIDESLKLTPGQLEQWKVMLSSGVNRRQRPWLNEDTKEFQVKTSVNVGIETTLATGNCGWQLQQPDPEGIKALESRFKNVVMPNARGNFDGSTNPNRNRALLALRLLVHEASDMALANTAGVVFGEGALPIFLKYLEAKGVPFFDRRRQAMFKAVVHGNCQMELYVKSRGLSARDRHKLYLREGFFTVGNIAAAYKTFAEVEQTHVHDVVVEALASLVDFNRSFSDGVLTGIEVRLSDCCGYLALPSTVSVSRSAVPRLAASVAAAVSKGPDASKLPDTGSVERQLNLSIDEGEIKIVNVDQRPRYGIPVAVIKGVMLPPDRDVLTVLIELASRLQIPQLTVDEESFILKEDVLESFIRNDVDAHSPSVATKWKQSVEAHGHDKLAESIARLKACGHIVEKRTAFMASYVHADEDTSPADQQRPSILKKGWNVQEGRKVNNVVVFSRTVGSMPRGGAASQTVGDRIANEFLSRCSPRHHNTEVPSLVRFYGNSVVPPRHMIRKPPANSKLLVRNPDYEGDAPCDGPDDGQEHCFIDPKRKQFDLSEFPDLDRISQRLHLQTNFPSVTDYDALLAALS
jgi:hypothetical protein